MNIIDIRANLSPTLIDEVCISLRNNFGIECHHVDASAMSAFTSLSVAAEIKKTNADAIICHRRKDLVGAIDALKLARRNDLNTKVIYAPQTEDALAEKLTKTTLNAVDIIVVPTPEDLSRKNFDGSKTTLIEPTAIVNPLTSPAHVSDTDTINITWLGPIVEHERLQNLINVTPSGFAIHVYGSGSARYIMPLIKGARHMDNLQITWHGDEYSDPDAIANSHLAVATTRIPSANDIRLRACSIPVLDATNTENLAQTLAKIAAEPQLLQSLSNDAKAEYDTRFSLCFHVEQWNNLLTAICK